LLVGNVACANIQGLVYVAIGYHHKFESIARCCITANILEE